MLSFFRASGILLLVGCSVATIACGDDEGTGGAGAATASTTGPGGPGPSTQDASTTANVTSSSTGEVGTCKACIATSCAVPPGGECGVGCQAWQACLDACAEGDLTCVQACHDGFAVPAAIFDGYIACVCDSCETECGAISPCQEKGCPTADNPPEVFTEPPATLSETHLYADIATKTLASGVAAYEPAYPLWSDGAEKARFIKLPRCATIGTADPDHFSFPTGTSLWKQFTSDGIVIETRLIHKFGPGEDDWIMAAYAWDDEALTEADHVPMGVMNARGTNHDIPAFAQCFNCHGKLDERILGFSAVQLSHAIDGSLSMASLAASGRIPESMAGGFPVPGNDVERAAIGYLHGNCGNCHNDSGVPVALKLRVLTGDTTVQDTDVFETAVDRTTQNFSCGGCDLIEPGDPTASAIIQRMTARGTSVQMPPLATTATEEPDDDGIADVTAWIESLMN